MHSVGTVGIGYRHKGAKGIDLTETLISLESFLLTQTNQAPFTASLILKLKLTSPRLTLSLISSCVVFGAKDCGFNIFSRTWLNRIAKAEELKPEPGVFWVWRDASPLEVLKQRYAGQVNKEAHITMLTSHMPQGEGTFLF